MTDETRENLTSAGSLRLEAEQAVRDSERYRAFIANSSEGIWRLEFDPPIDTSLPAEVQVDLAYRNGRFAECNQVMARMYGLERAEDLIGKTLDFRLPSSDSAARAYLASIIHADYHVVDVESTERDVAGSLRHFANSMKGVVEDGHLRRMWGTQRDISDLKLAAATQAYLAAERERLLESERVARAEAERASRVKDDFVAMVSHELRTPLNAMLGWTQLMLRDPHDTNVLERGLRVIARNTRVQAQLISDLLDVSRIVSGKLRLEIQRVEPASIVADAIETVQQDADAKGIEIRSQVDAEIGPVAGDPARLQQVVCNLLSNAIKFTPHGGHVQVTLGSAESNVEITVTDDGAGIRSEVLPHVFDRFHQADWSITRRFGGLGLGLAIVKHLVELHGGTARAESAGEGRGATFTIVLPSSTGSKFEENAQPATMGSKDADEAVSLGTLRVLVVDDEADTRELLMRLLQNHGAVVVAASAAAEALSLVQRERPDIVISDIGLPEVDGYDLMQQIRQLDVSAGGGIPAIALTAYARSEDRTRALRAGYQAHLAKPVEPNELVATIASFAELIDAQRRSR